MQSSGSCILRIETDPLVMPDGAQPITAKQLLRKENI
jgi:hypothetical protein